ncbi:ferredoxin [Clostridium sp.]
MDKGACIKCGLCEGICPKIFNMSEDEKASALESGSLGILLGSTNYAKER